MAHLNVKMDTRVQRPDGTSPIKISICALQKAAYIDTGVCLLPEQWDPISRCVVRHPERNRLNIELLGILNNYNETMEQIEELPKKSPQEIRRYLLDPSLLQEKHLVHNYLKDKMERIEIKGTKGIYRCLERSLFDFDQDFGSRTFEDITLDYLRRFDQHLSKTQKLNTRAIRMRSFRAVFNDAISNDITVNYPFRHFKIKTEETRKRSLSLEDLRDIRTMELEKWQEEYRDMFMLMMYLGGINAADLFQAKKTDIVDGRLEYRRQKTHRLYSVKIEPEAMAIIKKYRGKRYLLNVLDRYSQYECYLAHMNKALKTFGRKLGKQKRVLSMGRWPELSTYWTRHSIATLCSHLGVNIDVISQILGHSFGNPTTAIYVRPDPKRADKAIRLAIDAIIGKIDLSE